jgi:hypothetical protein
MKFNELVALKNALEALGKERLPIAYELAKNIHLADQAINEAQELARELYTKFVDRDENGDVIPYMDQEGQQITRITDTTNLNAYLVEIKKMESVDYEINFVKIGKSTLAKKDLLAEQLIPLLSIIDEDK